MTILGSNPRAQVDPLHPEAFAICDRCGFLHNHKDLRWQMVYAGNALVKTGSLVCDKCLDIPFELNRPLFLPPDPEPFPDARPPRWAEQIGEMPDPPYDHTQSADPDP